MAQLGIDSTQLARLLREDWNAVGTQTLAEEIYTILGGGDTSSGSKSSSPSIKAVTGGQPAPGAAGTPGAPGVNGLPGNTVNQGPQTVLSPSDGGAGLVLIANQGDDLSVHLVFGDDTGGDINFGPVGLTLSLDAGNIDFPVTQTVPVQDGVIQLPAISALSGGGIPCQVVSGSGKDYQIKLFRNGPDQPGEVVSAKVLQIDDSETVPEGTWAIATQAGTDVQTGPRYFFQPPIWL